MKNMSKTFEILAGALMVLGLASCQEVYIWKMMYNLKIIGK